MESQHILFCDWFLSQSTLFSRFIHLSTSFLFIAEKYHIVCLHHVIYPFTNQLMYIYQGCSYFFGITNNAAINIHGHVFRFFWVYLEDKLLSHMVTLFQSTQTNLHSQQQCMRALNSAYLILATNRALPASPSQQQGPTGTHGFRAPIGFRIMWNPGQPVAPSTSGLQVYFPVWWGQGGSKQEWLCGCRTAVSVSIVYPPDHMADQELWPAVAAQHHRRVLYHVSLNQGSSKFPKFKVQYLLNL